MSKATSFPHLPNQYQIMHLCRMILLYVENIGLFLELQNFLNVSENSQNNPQLTILMPSSR